MNTLVMPPLYQQLLTELPLPVGWAPVPWVPFAEMTTEGTSEASG